MGKRLKFFFFPLMTEEQIKMLRFIIKQEIEAAGIDGLYDHGAAAWAERMLDENWEEFQQSLLMPDENEYTTYESIEELFEDLHSDEKIWLKKKLDAEAAPWLNCADGFKDLPDEDADLIDSGSRVG